MPQRWDAEHVHRCRRRQLVLESAASIPAVISRNRISPCAVSEIIAVSGLRRYRAAGSMFLMPPLKGLNHTRKVSAYSSLM